jgi:hypothetical protein
MRPQFHWEHFSVHDYHWSAEARKYVLNSLDVCPRNDRKWDTPPSSTEEFIFDKVGGHSWHRPDEKQADPAAHSSSKFDDAAGRKTARHRALERARKGCNDMITDAEQYGLSPASVSALKLCIALFDKNDELEATTRQQCEEITRLRQRLAATCNEILSLKRELEEEKSARIENEEKLASLYREIENLRTVTPGFKLTADMFRQPKWESKLDQFTGIKTMRLFDALIVALTRGYKVKLRRHNDVPDSKRKRKCSDGPKRALSQPDSFLLALFIARSVVFVRSLFCNLAVT